MLSPVGPVADQTVEVDDSDDSGDVKVVDQTEESNDSDEEYSGCKSLLMTCLAQH